MSLQAPTNPRDEQERKTSLARRVGLSAAALLGIGVIVDQVAVKYDRDSVRDAVAMCTGGRNTEEQVESCAEITLMAERGLWVLDMHVGIVSGQISGLTIGDEVKAAVGRQFHGSKDLLEPELEL